MSKEISSTIDDAKLQTEKEINPPNTINHETDNNATSQTLGTESIDKTPISSATTFKESLKNENGDPLVLVNESFENTEPAEGFNETECVKFAEKLYKIVEELRTGRISEKENESRIQNLMSEKNDLERVKDDEASKKQELIQKHSAQQDEIRKQFDDKLRSFQEEKTKHILERQSGEQEIIALKDEIRSLYINKYSMEKMIKDQERQIQNHGTSNTNYLTQMAKVENQCKDIFKQCSQVLATVDKVEANINSSTKLNKKLSFMNEHQKCVLQTYKEKYEKTKQELISAQADKVSSSAEGEDSNNTKESMVRLEDELRMQKELCQQVQMQLNDSRQEIQELLKSLDNAHCLLAKHVETNNMYAESEIMLQLELDDLRTDCEKHRDELSVEKASVQEKYGQITELKNTMEEKLRRLGEQIEKLQKENDSLKNEKQFLEELNSTWSKNIVEQKDEIESMKNKVIGMETSMKEMRQKLDVKSSEVETLEEKLKTETSRYEDLLQKAEEETAKNSNEADKWRQRTTELLQNEEKLKAELDKVNKENKMKEPQNQCTQTEVTETANKETNTISILNDIRKMLNKGTTTQDLTSDIQHGEDKTKSQDQDTILQSGFDKLPHASADKGPSLEKLRKSAKDNLDDLRLPVTPKNTHITTSSNETKLRKNTSTTYDKPDVTAGTNHHKTETPTESPSKDANFAAISTNNQTPAPSNTLVEGVLLLEGEDTVLSSRQANGVPRSHSAQGIHAASQVATKQSKNSTPSKNPILQSKITAAQNTSMTVPSYSPSEENTNSLTQRGLSLPSQHGNTPNQIAVSESQIRSTPSQMSIPEGKTATMLLGMTENTLGSKSQEKRTPLLAVVKPSSAGKLMESTGNRSSVTDAQPRRSEALSTTEDNNLISETTKSYSNLTNVSFVQNSSVTSSQLRSRTLIQSETRPHASSQTHTQIMAQPRSETSSQLPPQIPSQTRSQTLIQSLEKIKVDISDVNTKDDQNSKTVIPTQLGLESEPSLRNISDQEILQSASETSVLISRATKTTDPNQTHSSRKPTNKISALGQLLEKPLKETDSYKGKPNFEQNMQSERKQESKSTSEDFCFSDEDDESIPRAIGSQVDRIETFLKNERLRLSKKRKATDE